MWLFTLDLKEVETNFCPEPFICGTLFSTGKSCVPSGWGLTVSLTVWKARLWLKACLPCWKLQPAKREMPSDGRTVRHIGLMCAAQEMKGWHHRAMAWDLQVLCPPQHRLHQNHEALYSLITQVRDPILKMANLGISCRVMGFTWLWRLLSPKLSLCTQTTGIRTQNTAPSTGRFWR